MNYLIAGTAHYNSVLLLCYYYFIYGFIGRPNENHLSILMKQVIVDSATTLSAHELIRKHKNSYFECAVSVMKGLLARKTMRETFSAVSVVNSIAERLRVHAKKRGWLFL